MIFRQLFDPATSTYTYLLATERGGEAVILDPVREQAQRDLGLIGDLALSLRWIVESHVHADHVTGAQALKKATGAQTAVSRQCGATGFDRLLDDGDMLAFGDQRLQVIATPGHTLGSSCFLWQDRLFTGDTLLIGGCGRTDFQHGSAAALFESITGRLFTLPDDTLVYPGHDYRGRRVSTIGEEKATNPRLAGKTREQFIEIMENLDLPQPERIGESVPANLRGGVDA
ncbi:MAG TPA: MBL fold metallo-hydrolase [Burkholderiales bacterium]|nr:MBL fold metallo-hydrolase [Burkholderiales bacterium]